MPVASQNNLSATSSAATESVTKASSAVITEQPQSSSPIASLTTPGTTFYSIDPPNVREEDQENKEDSQQEAPASEVSTADFDEVVRERSALQKRVSELQSKTAELESQNIRQRKQISDSRKSETTPQLKPSAEIAVDNNGIPVIVFVLIALIVGLVVGKLLF
ncbi:uncharacterized protein LOC134178886 [Corticium candelabrum]|uniref:uncharacterized protein LOC134178886 n=1 Tax=Corticium candelabrum TaxID=121492 RepID=UPI002E26B71D|nr:uncharacterized protein LOC134178886 [Corticium candelabrum]